MDEPVSLQKVVEELEALMQGCTAYLDRRTGELYTVTDEEAALVDNEVDADDLPDWQREMLPKIREVIESEDWLELPTSFDIHEWEIMDSFSRSIEDADVRDELLNAIRGSGAFRFFRHTIHQLGIEKSWYQFKKKTLERIAADWLDENEIPYRP